MTKVNLVKGLIGLGLLISISGCGPSFEDVKPGYSTKPVKPYSEKSTIIETAQTSSYPYDKAGKLLPFNKISAKITKEINLFEKK